LSRLGEIILFIGIITFSGSVIFGYGKGIFLGGVSIIFGMLEMSATKS